MAFEDCYAATLDLCSDCVGHIDGDGGGCCHSPHHGDPRPYYVLRHLAVDPMDDRPCPTGVKLERRHRDVVAFTAGCTDDDCETCQSLGFMASDCDGCGAGHGDREHYTAWVRRDPRPERVITRRGWRVVISPFTGGGLYAVARHDDGTTKYGPWTPRGGAERWQRMAQFLATLPA